MCYRRMRGAISIFAEVECCLSASRQCDIVITGGCLMLKVRIPMQQSLILDNISWERYTRLLHMFSDRHLRMTYDRGILEIMTLSHEHEIYGRFLGRMVI